MASSRRGSGAAAGSSKGGQGVAKGLKKKKAKHGPVIAMASPLSEITTTLSHGSMKSSLTICTSWKEMPRACTARRRRCSVRSARRVQVIM